MEKLIEVIRKPEFDPELYGGFMYSDFQFMKVFFLHENSLENTFKDANFFLLKNGYSELSFEKFLPELYTSEEKISLYADTYATIENKKLVLIINKYSPHENPIDEILLRLIRFRNERDWQQFHNSKDLALALNVEAGELLELFLWKNAEDAEIEKIKDELADVFTFGFLLAEKYGFDIRGIVLDKIDKNEEKYPVSKSKGTSKKYTEL